MFAAPSAPRKCFACLALAVALLTATGFRQQLGVGSSGFHAKSAAERFALNRSHIDSLCTDEVSSGACEVLAFNPNPHASATAAELAVLLAASEDEAADLLRNIGLNADKPFGCRAFCEAAVVSIPRILSMAAPPKAGFGCINAACAGEQVDVSADALAHEGLELPRHPSKGDDVLDLPDSEAASRRELDPNLRAELLFRMSLNVVLEIFPAVDEIDGPTTEAPGHSLLQRGLSSNVPTPRPALIFGGPESAPERHRQYAEYVMKASAWISLALRRLRTGRPYLEKWFVLDDDWQVRAQEKEARRHLTRILQLTSNIMIKEETPEEPCTGKGVIAYVYRLNHCRVQSLYDCGQRDSTGRYVVNVCELFWVSWHTPEERVGTLLHEASHHFGTVDVAYCTDEDCLSLRPTQARSNADSYAEFVRELVTARRIDQEPSGVGEEACNAECGASQFGAWDFSRDLPNNHCGICREKWNPGRCNPSEVKVAQGVTKALCCEPVQCKTTTMTTTTLLCPSGMASMVPDAFGDCHCPAGQYCSESGADSLEDCRCSNLYEPDDPLLRRAFFAGCATCKCYQGR